MCDNERLCAMEPCFTIERLLAVTGNYGIMKKKAQMRREILRGSDTYVSN